MERLTHKARYVSIHVPTRGTTLHLFSISTASKVSIHVPTRGTTRISSNVSVFIEFQSTFPRGERRGSELSVSEGWSFNPRSHEGNDKPEPNSHIKSGVSIHVPTRGTTKLSTLFVVVIQFQSTFPRGERLDLDGVWHHSYGFNPRSHEGNDNTGRWTIVYFGLFQSTFPRGERP